MDNKPPILVFVLYDSITNSVFEGQVLAPLQKMHQENPVLKIILISFEYTAPPLPSNHEWLEIVIMRKYRFLMNISLWPSIRQLHTYLRRCKPYTLIARGPLATIISKRAVINTLCTQLTIQVRGLLAAEYEFTHRHNKGSRKYLDYYRIYQYRCIEKEAYQENKLLCKVHLEAVSKELLAYVRQEYKSTLPSSVATYDIPPKISSATLKVWRKEIRQTLMLGENDYVYCYNGSAKAWQCPDLTIKFFYQEWIKNKTVKFLILTQEPHLFRRFIESYSIEHNAYRIMTIKHQYIYNYLAACDAGILLREKHIVNWTSRPTKALEYAAVGLTIIHNNTVAMIKDFPTALEKQL